MTPPSLREIAARSAALVEEHARFVENYAYAYNASLSSGSPGEGGRSLHGAVVDPTGAVVGSEARAKLRRACQRAAKNLQEASAEIRSANFILEHALDIMDPRPSADLPKTLQYRVSRAELAESRNAKARRLQAGAGFGEG